MKDLLRLGILGCADIAYKRFLPAVKQIDNIHVVAIAEEYDKSRLSMFCEEYGLEMVGTFDELIHRKDIDAVYIPQPPALHYKWAKAALEAGKHVLVEKPATISYDMTKELIDIAASKKLALHENYMFQYHSQIKNIQELVCNGVIGEVRLYKTCFGFPMRAKNDFRYSKALGGGALLDAGGYTAKLATILLGRSIKVDNAMLNTMNGFEVDMFGSASFSNEHGTVCQIAFGMDCSYQCSLEIWGNKGRLYTNRIFTAPDGYEPVVEIEDCDGKRKITLKADMHFKHSVEMFAKECEEEQARLDMYEQVCLQAKLVEAIKNKGSMKGE